MDVLNKTSLSSLRMLLRVFVNIGECLASSWVDVRIDTVVQNSEELFFGNTLLWERRVSQFYLFLLEGLLCNFRGFLLKVLLFFVFDKRQFVSQSQEQLSDITEESDLPPRLDGESLF